MTKKQKTNLANIKLLVMDVDGVLTNGTVMINGDGSEGKLFNLQDGHGIRMWRNAGLKVAFLSGRFSEATKRRAEQLEVDFCVQDCFEKLPALRKLLEDMGVSAKDTAYIGDDLLDLPAIKYVGFGVAVANAVDEVKDAAAHITKRRGGDGAVREVIEYILKTAGPLRRGRIAASKWQELMQKYH